MKGKRAQNIVEYTIFLAALIVAIRMMQFYVRRGLQSSYQEVADQATSAMGTPAQFEPNYRQQDFITGKNTDILENKRPRGAQRSIIVTDEATREGTSQERVNPYDAAN